MKTSTCERQKTVEEKKEDVLDSRTKASTKDFKDASLELLQIVSQFPPYDSPPTETKGRRQSLRSGFNQRLKSSSKCPSVSQKTEETSKETQARKAAQNGVTISKARGEEGSESRAENRTSNTVIPTSNVNELSADSLSEAGSSKLFSFDDSETEESDVKALVDDATDLEYHSDENTGSISSLSEPEYSSFSDSSDEEDNRVIMITRAFMGNMICHTPHEKEIGNMTCNLQRENGEVGAFSCLLQQEKDDLKKKMQKYIQPFEPKTRCDAPHSNTEGEQITNITNSVILAEGKLVANQYSSEEDSLDDADKEWIESLEKSFDAKETESMTQPSKSASKHLLRRSASCKTSNHVERSNEDDVLLDENISHGEQSTDREGISVDSLYETAVLVPGGYMGDPDRATILL